MLLHTTINKWLEKTRNLPQLELSTAVGFSTARLSSKTIRWLHQPVASSQLQTKSTQTAREWQRMCKMLSWTCSRDQRTTTSLAASCKHLPSLITSTKSELLHWTTSQLEKRPMRQETPPAIDLGIHSYSLLFQTCHTPPAASSESEERITYHIVHSIIKLENTHQKNLQLQLKRFSDKSLMHRMVPTREKASDFSIKEAKWAEWDKESHQVSFYWMLNLKTIMLRTTRRFSREAHQKMAEQALTNCTKVK